MFFKIIFKFMFSKLPDFAIGLNIQFHLFIQTPEKISICSEQQSVAYAENFRGGGQVSSQSCDVTNQLREVPKTILWGSGGMPPGKFCKIAPKNTLLCILEASFRQYCFYIFLFLGSEGLTMAQWPPPSVR